jgi:glycosyltransferase involved in cell wall biosynthesis
MKKIRDDRQLRETMKEKGWKHAQNFTQQKSAAAVVKVYEELVQA